MGDTPDRKPLLWLANAPWCPTGYGQQTDLFTKKIHDQLDYDVALVANHGLDGAVLPWRGMPVYPTDHTNLAKYRLPEYAAHFAGDDIGRALLITLMDIWTLVDLRWGGHAFWESIPKVASWVPIDHSPVPPNTLQAIHDLGIRPIAMSRFGHEQLVAHGCTDALYVPHGVDTEVFQPRDRSTYKRQVGLPDDAFIVGMVANNQGCSPPRKAFPQVLQAFAIFAKEHPNAYLYLHTDIMGFRDGVNLIPLMKLLDVPADRLIQTEQGSYHRGIPPEKLSNLYSMFDVLVNPSYGEGFGIPIIEAQACGTPVIVTDWTAMPELVGAGWKVQGDRWYNAGSQSFLMCPAVIEIYDALELAYQARGDQDLRHRAVAFASAYDAETVFDTYWRPALAELDKWTPGGKANREQRRTKAKS